MFGMMPRRKAKNKSKRQVEKDESSLIELILAKNKNNIELTHTQHHTTPHHTTTPTTHLNQTTTIINHKIDIEKQTDITLTTTSIVVAQGEEDLGDETEFGVVWWERGGYEEIW